MRLAMILAAALLGVSCSGHPLDCSLGIEHRDCRPGTAGHTARQERLAADRTACLEYGFQEGTPDYAQCRMVLDQSYEQNRSEALRAYFANRPRTTTTECAAEERFDQVLMRCVSTQ